MTMVDERTRSLVNTWDFLHKLSRNDSLPESLRLQEKQLYGITQNRRRFI